MKKLINDTLKERGRWSQTKLIVFFSFWAYLFFTYYCFKYNVKIKPDMPLVVPDIPVGWLTLILGGSVMKQIANSTERIRGVTYADSANSGETVGK